MAANTRKTGKKSEVTFEFMGVEVVIPSRLADDWEFLEMVADAKHGDQTSIVGLVRTITGDAYEAVKEAVRAEKGYVSGEAMGELVAVATAALEEKAPNS